MVEHYRGEVADLISGTVQKWDGKSTAERLELQVGRDLQFIRINGTLVGGLAGLAIHTISQLAFCALAVSTGADLDPLLTVPSQSCG